MASSITGNNFKGVISKVSDTRDPLELNIALIEKSSRHALDDPIRLQMPQTGPFSRL